MKFCENCGCELSGPAKFCANCGSQVVNSTTQSNQQTSHKQQTSNTPQKIAPKKKSKRSLIILILTGLILLSAITVAALEFTGFINLFGTATRRQPDGSYAYWNENGYILYYQDAAGNWSKYEYDENNHLTSYETSDGYREESEYDKNGELIQKVFSSNTFTYATDKNGNTIYREDTYFGESNRREYNEDGNITYEKDSNGYWYRYEYDENGKKTYFEDSHGTIYHFDENERLIYWKDPFDFIRTYEYDSFGNVVTSYASDDGITFEEDKYYFEFPERYFY